jgi:hypothetical protein
MEIINKIGFFIGDSRKLDFYKNVVDELNTDHYELIINDIRLKDQDEIDKMDRLITSRNYPRRFASELVEDNKVFKVVVGVGNYGITRKKITPKDLLKFLYARTAGTILELTGLARVAKKAIRRDVTAGGSKAALMKSLYFAGTDSKWVRWKNPIGRISPESVLGKIRVLFPRGMDVAHDYPGDYRSADFHHFFCHGESDKNIVEKNTKKPTHIIGYPRYDNVEEWDDQKLNELAAEFGINRKKSGKPIVLWLTSSMDWISDKDDNTRLWKDAMLSLQDEFEVIYRPHPTRVRANGEMMDELNKNGLKMDYSSARDMTGMYTLADYVICDYGGTIFSALYCDKKIVLLNNPEQPSAEEDGSMDIQMRSSFVNLDPDPNGNNAENLKSVLKDEELWNKQLPKSSELRKTLFGGAPVGEGAKRAAQLLTEFLSR